MLTERWSTLTKKWPDLEERIAIGIVAGLFLIVAGVYGPVASGIFFASCQVAYLYRQSLLSDLKHLQTKFDIAHRSFRLAASGPQGLAIVKGLLNDYGVSHIDELNKSKSLYFLEELKNKEENMEK